MFKISHFIILFALFLQEYRGNDLEETFRELFLVPDIIDEAPSQQLKVNFTGDNGTIVLTPGQLLPGRFQEVKPRVSWLPWNDKSFYTLYMTGITKWYLEVHRKGNPNVTGVTHYPFGYEWHTWIIANIPGNKTSKGETIFPYIPPVNPAKQELTDRYAIFVFEQPQDKIKIDPPVDPNEGYKFNELSTLRDFVRKYELGIPKFGNCFTFRWVEGTTIPPAQRMRYDPLATDKPK